MLHSLYLHRLHYLIKWGLYFVFLALWRVATFIRFLLWLWILADITVTSLLISSPLCNPASPLCVIGEQCICLLLVYGHNWTAHQSRISTSSFKHEEFWQAPIHYLRLYGKYAGTLDVVCMRERVKRPEALAVVPREAASFVVSACC